ncbi:MAG TPA: hypothetical protein V6C65_09545 [Allocoleopsis sp.]
MSTGITTVEKPEDKREQLKKLREYHQPTLNYLGVPEAAFVPKMAYRPYGKDEIHIAFFESEISKGHDVFVEFASKDNIPEDPERTLWKWRFNPDFKTAYSQTEPNAKTGHVRYLVPVKELIKVSPPPKKEAATTQGSLTFDLMDPDMDCKLPDVTLRDIAAILFKKPISQKTWLNDIIINSTQEEKK